MKTYVATPTDRERNWLLVDATGQTLGRLATQIADALRGKRKPTYTPHVDTGDFVIVVNAEKISVTGNKRAAKRYYRHSGYPGRAEVAQPGRDARAPARGGHPPRGQGHAAPQPAGSQAADQAQGVRRSRASARRPAAATDGDCAVTEAEQPEDEQRDPRDDGAPGDAAARGRASPTRRSRRRGARRREPAAEPAPAGRGARRGAGAGARAEPAAGR